MYNVDLTIYVLPRVAGARVIFHYLPIKATTGLHNVYMYIMHVNVSV